MKNCSMYAGVQCTQVFNLAGSTCPGQKDHHSCSVLTLRQAWMSLDNLSAGGNPSGIPFTKSEKKEEDNKVHAMIHYCY